MGKSFCIKGLRLIAFVLVAIAQLIPSGFAFSTHGDGVSIVICTADGAQSVSWADYFGEEFPQHPSEDDAHNPCHACVSTCRVCALAGTEQAGYYHPYLRNNVTGQAKLIPVAIPSRTMPPMPSRSPPAHLL